MFEVNVSCTWVYLLGCRILLATDGSEEIEFEM